MSTNYELFRSWKTVIQACMKLNKQLISAQYKIIFSGQWISGVINPLVLFYGIFYAFI